MNKSNRREIVSSQSWAECGSSECLHSKKSVGIKRFNDLSNFCENDLGFLPFEFTYGYFVFSFSLWWISFTKAKSMLGLAIIMRFVNKLPYWGILQCIFGKVFLIQNLEKGAFCNWEVTEDRPPLYKEKKPWYILSQTAH